MPAQGEEGFDGQRPAVDFQVYGLGVLVGKGQQELIITGCALLRAWFDSPEQFVFVIGGIGEVFYIVPGLAAVGVVVGLVIVGPVGGIKAQLDLGLGPGGQGSAGETQFQVVVGQGFGGCR